MQDADVIIIGSGPAGVQAATVLRAIGTSVLMLDGGKQPPCLQDPPDENFEDVRRYSKDQTQWFLGHDLSGIPISGLTGGLGGGQVSGNRANVVASTREELPITEENCQVIQSLAEGGLGAAWGAACSVPEPSELQAMGVNVNDMQRHFDAVIDDIGVSGPQVRQGMQPALPPDLHASLALAAYERKRPIFNSRHLSVTQPLSAVLTQDKDSRRASNLADMEYWADPRRSVYRPQYTLEKLRSGSGFTYNGDLIVERIASDTEGCTVYARRMAGGTESFRAKRVILAAGAIGSARIALQSLELYDRPLPFAAKPHVFSACLHGATLGKTGPKERTSLCQLLILDEQKRQNCRSGCAQLYSYRSLMLFRLLGSQPLAYPEAMRILSMLTPALVIADIRFPAFGENGSVSLAHTNEGNVMRIHCRVPEEERQARNRSWKRLRQGLRMLGMIPLKNMELPEGSASHYGGTLPMQHADRILTTDARGKLRGVRHVSVADASVFPILPAVPHTLTLMANARRIAEAVAEDL